MKKVFAFFLYMLLLVSCHKKSEMNKHDANQACMTGKIVAIGCYGNMIIQVVTPLPDFLKSSVYKIGDNQPEIEYVIGTSIPISSDHQVGDILYFRVKEFGEIGDVTTMDCIWPKYAAEIENISDTSCN